MTRVAAIIAAAVILAPAAAYSQLNIFSPFANRPSDDFPLDLVWRADTFTPAWYVGKALPTSGSIVTVTALTPARESASLDFFWNIGGALGEQGAELAGRGEDTIAFGVPPLLASGGQLIEVTVQDPQTGETARGSVAIPIVRPEAALYDISAGYIGTQFPRAVRTRPGTLIELLAFPFHFNVRSAEGLTFAWSLGERAVPPSGRPTLLELSIGGQSGEGVEEARVTIRSSAVPGEQAGAAARITIHP